jgi:hypothetical protein
VIDGARVPLPKGDPTRGSELFNSEPLEHFSGRDCSSCHGGETSSGGGGYSGISMPSNLTPAVTELPSLTQSDFKPSQLRNLHEKVGFDAGSTASLSGFGYLHDRTINTLTRYLTQPQSEETASPQDVADTIAFLYTKNGANVPAPENKQTRMILSGSIVGGIDQGFLNALFGRREAIAKAIHAGIGTQLAINAKTESLARIFGVSAYVSKAERSNNTLSAIPHTDIADKKQTWVYNLNKKTFIAGRQEEATFVSIREREGFQYGIITPLHPNMIPRLIGDSDKDGLLDEEETRDLDPETPGIQNPFDPNNPDSTGIREAGPDNFVDGLNDYDGDGITNQWKFINGTSPIHANGPLVREYFPIQAIPKGRGISLRWESLPWVKFHRSQDMAYRRRPVPGWRSILL